MHATIRDRLRGSVAEATKRGAVSRGATSTRTNLKTCGPGVIQRAVRGCLCRTSVPRILILLYPLAANTLEVHPRAWHKLSSKVETRSRAISYDMYTRSHAYRVRLPY